MMQKCGCVCVPVRKTGPERGSDPLVYSIIDCTFEIRLGEWYIRQRLGPRKNPLHDAHITGRDARMKTGSADDGWSIAFKKS